jgi:serine/threonine-protein kinase
MTLAGTKIGHFRIDEPLGHGGMGEVYLGFNEVLKKKVALKALRAERRLSAASRARFLREARILSSLEHPNICRIYDYFEGDDADFLVLELIDGRSLDVVIREGLDHATKLRIAEQIARVLIEAHAAEVVHRDLKPSNVMLTSDGQVKVLDFGLARPTHEAPIGEPGRRDGAAREWPGPQEGSPGDDRFASDDAVTVDRLEASTTFLQTAFGSVLGTPSYMSPEQARGEPATSASDMYSFGLLLQMLFTGRSPYDKKNDALSLLERAMRAQTRPVTGIDSDLTHLINRMKSLAPSSRPTAIEAAGRLRRIRGKPKRRIRRLVIGVAVVLVALAGSKYALDMRRGRLVALEARDEALQRRAQAEELISFMLGDLRKKLEPLGRLDILDDVGDQALDYFESVDEALLTDDELSKHSQALNQIGEVRIAQGNLEAALGAFRESLSMATRSPHDRRSVAPPAAGSKPATAPSAAAERKGPAKPPTRRTMSGVGLRIAGPEACGL